MTEFMTLVKERQEDSREKTVDFYLLKELKSHGRQVQRENSLRRANNAPVKQASQREKHECTQRKPGTPQHSVRFNTRISRPMRTHSVNATVILEESRKYFAF